VATWWSPFVDGPTGYCTPAGSKGYVQPLNDFATPALGEAVPSNEFFAVINPQKHYHEKRCSNMG
jgi:hypothetical protein